MKFANAPGFRSVVPAILLTLGLGASASAVTIDFTSEPTGAKANGFSPVDFGGIHFFDTVGSSLDVEDFGTQGHGNALAVYTDTDGSILRMTFDSRISTFSLAFGNDDPFFTNDGDLAMLRGYLDGAFVAFITVKLNRDDVMNQVIGFGPGEMNEVTFGYTDALGNPYTGGGAGLIEVVDDIHFDVIPEPGTMGLLGLGLAGLGLRAFRRRSR